MIDFIKTILKTSKETEEFIYQICQCTGKTKKEVLLFYQTHKYSIREIRDYALERGRLIE